MTSLSGKVVLITGGARGVGAEVARRVHRRGARLVLVDLDAAPLEAMAAELGPDALPVVADVRDLPAMESAVAQGIERFGGIDIVMANAGIASYGSVLAVDPAAFRRLIDVNVVGVFHTVRAALPSIVERRGYVLIVSSAAAYAAAPGLAPYCASKAGVEHFANSLRLEVAHLGVDVGSAHMSWIDTPMVQDAKADLPAFRKMLAALPGPLGKTTSVEVCGRGFERGIERRAKRINVPGWVGVARWLKPLMQTTLAERDIRNNAGTLLPEMDAEVAGLGRSVSARMQALDEADPKR
ncbi:SDR family oxidoreductase [Rhodococcus spelaei]|uniref:SDR family oxidoreductase n=1 Tax=Rhodococcus spelaei TaxID=2546320 RepID=A0A541BML8_9NOCA|nr:SDR family oxidoreductase [Rhodococcus spelaei]TQF73581.1 SDR family oxidoreductase [Rhodococcus spelaei]